MDMNCIKIEITQADIDEGVRANKAYCILSTKLGRMLPKALYIETKRDFVRFTIPEERRRYHYPSPPEVVRYIKEFDKGGRDSVTPTRFVLRDPIITESARKSAPRLIVKALRPVGAPPPERRSRRVWGEQSWESNQDDDTQ